jgi:primosomal protein N'
MECPHCGVDLEMFEDDHIYFCCNCNKAVATTCYACNGTGHVQENEYECDWVNFADVIIICPECGGDGVEF